MSNKIVITTDTGSDLRPENLKKFHIDAMIPFQAENGLFHDVLDDDETFYVTTIGDDAFFKCKGLTSVVISDGITSIRGGAFESCEGLTSITIPSSVTSITGLVFLSCDNLTAVHINDIAAWCNIEYDNKFATPLLCAHNLYLNDQLVVDLIIPESVTNIKMYTFYGCTSLKSLTMPASLENIGKMAFMECSGIRAITCKAVIPPMCDGNCFSEINKAIPLYVPAESINIYSAANVWKDFVNIHEIQNTEDIELLQSGKSERTKKIHNGVLYIERDNKTFTLQGQEVK